MSTINDSLNLKNDLNNMAHHLLEKQNTNRLENLRYSDGRDKFPRLRESEDLKILQEKVLTVKTNFELEEYRNDDLFSSKTGTEQLDGMIGKRLGLPNVLNKEKDTLERFGTCILKQSFPTQLSPSPFANGHLGSPSSAFDEHKTTSEPFRSPSDFNHKQHSNDGSRDVMNDIYSKAIESYQNMSFVGENMCKESFQDDFLDHENKAIFLTRSLSSPIQSNNSDIQRSVHSTEELKRGSSCEPLENLRNDMAIKDGPAIAKTMGFKPKFDPRYGMTNSSAKLIEILNYEMKTPNNYVEVVIKQIEEDLAMLKNKNSFYDRIMQFITKNTCSIAKENYFLLKDRLDMVKLNPWCAFEHVFWEGSLTEERTYGSIKSSSFEEEENNSSFSNFNETNDQFIDFLNNEHESHSSKLAEHCFLKETFMV